MAGGSPWTEDERATLRLKWPDMTRVGISQILPGRSPSSVRNQALALGLLKKGAPQCRWVADKIARARAMWDAGEGHVAICAACECAATTLARLRHHQNWPLREYKHRRDTIDAVVAERVAGMMPKGIAALHGIRPNQVAGILSRYWDRPHVTKVPSTARKHVAKPRLPVPMLPRLPSLSASAVVCAPPAAAIARQAPPAHRPVLVEAFGPPVAPHVFSQCCWPIGEPGTRAFRYCDADVMDRGQYCAECRKRAFAKSAHQQREAA